MKIFNPILGDEPNVAVQIKDLKLLSKYNIIDNEKVAETIIHSIINSVNAPDDYVYVIFKNQDVIDYFYKENCIIDYDSISKENSDAINLKMTELKKANIKNDILMHILGNENWRKGLLVDSQIISNMFEDMKNHMDGRNNTLKETEEIKNKIYQKLAIRFQQAV